MLKKLLIILILSSNLSLSQTEKDNYSIYLKILTERLELGLESKVDSIVIIEKYYPKFPPEFDVVHDFTADSIPNWALNHLSLQTYGNSEFVQRIINEPQLKDAIRDFTTDFKNHPKVNAELLANDNLNVQTITSDKYYSFFGRKFKRKNAWKRIKKKYGTRHVVEFSKIKYHEDFATIYYEHHCGGLCGSGNMVVFEKKNGVWTILSEINFWMS